MSYNPILLDLPELYNAVYTFSFGTSGDAIIGSYPEFDINGMRRPLMRAELGNRLVSLATAEYLSNFYSTVGQGTAFNYKCWLDYEFDNSIIAFMMGEAKTVQLIKTYAVGEVNYNKPITKPVVDDTELFINGTQLNSGFTINYFTGVVNLDSTLRGYVTVRGGYHTPVRFENAVSYAFHSVDPDTDEDLYWLQSLVLVEVPYQPSAFYEPSVFSSYIPDLTLPTSEATSGSFDFANGEVIDPDFSDLDDGIISLYKLASAAFSNSNLVNLYRDVMQVGEINALATATAALLEVRRMMPFGIKWFSEERVSDTSSVIGSLLYAESEIYYRTGLSIYALETERSPLTAKFDAPQKWFNAFFQVPSIGSEVFLKRLINLFLNFNSTDLAVYVEFINNFFNIESTLTFPQLPNFLAYDFETSNLDYVYVGLPRVGELVGANVKSLTAGEYYSINYKLVNKEWIPRRVPGLPVFIEDLIPTDPDVESDYLLVTADEYLANPKSNHLIDDGNGIGVLPLLNYVMRASIDLNGATPYLLEWINNTLLPAGLLITYTTTTLLAGD